MHFGLASVLPAAGGAVLLGVRWGMSALAAYLVAVNGATFALYAWDKAAARRQRRRVPERLLHAWALVGGTPAALVAQHLLRHKTIKRGFQTTFWVVAGLQAVALVAWWRLARGT